MSQNFSQRLKDLREQHGYTQDALASELYVSRQAISQWENGKSSPDVDKLVALAQLYSISVDELLGADETTSSLDDLSSSPEERQHNSAILEQLALAVISILSAQFFFAPIIINLFLIFWLKKEKKNYKISFVLCIICLLIGCYNSFIFITSWLPNWGVSYVEPV